MGVTGIVIFPAWFAGAFVAGVTGLGAALVALPGLSFSLPMRVNVPVSCLLLFSLVVVLFPQHRRLTRPRAVLPLLAGGRRRRHAALPRAAAVGEQYPRRPW